MTTTIVHSKLDHCNSLYHNPPMVYFQIMLR